MVKALTKILAVELKLSFPPPPQIEDVPDEDPTDINEASDDQPSSAVKVPNPKTLRAVDNNGPKVNFVPKRTMKIFFPDMGAAALARRDWKMGTELAEVRLLHNTPY